MHKKRNLALEIGVLEAMSGAEPAIRRSKSIASVHLKRTPAPSPDADERLRLLRAELAARKVFAAKRVIRRAVKSARQAALQRAIKRLKRARDTTSIDANDTAAGDAKDTISVDANGTIVSDSKDNIDAEENDTATYLKSKRTFSKKACSAARISTLEDEMRAIKEASLDALAYAFYTRSVLGSSEYLSSRLGTQSEGKESEGQASESVQVGDERAAARSLISKIENNTLRLVLANLADSLEAQVRRVFCEPLSVPSDGPLSAPSHDAPAQKDRPLAGPEYVQNVKTGRAPSQRGPAGRNARNSRDTRRPAQDDAPKNRMGQRARREVWERMYGKEARHVQRERVAKPQTTGKRPFGQSAGPRPAHRAHAAGSDRPFGQSAASRPAYRAHAAGNGARPQIAQTSERLHPSWEARKQQQRAVSSAPAPTRIVFDD